MVCPFTWLSHELRLAAGAALDNGGTRRLLSGASPSGREPPGVQAAAIYPSYVVVVIVAGSSARPMRVVLAADAVARARGLTSAK